MLLSLEDFWLNGWTPSIPGEVVYAYDKLPTLTAVFDSQSTSTSTGDRVVMFTSTFAKTQVSAASGDAVLEFTVEGDVG